MLDLLARRKQRSGSACASVLLPAQSSSKMYGPMAGDSTITTTFHDFTFADGDNTSRAGE